MKLTGVGDHVEIMGIDSKKRRSDMNDSGAAGKRYSGGQSAAALDSAGGPELILCLGWFE